MLPYTIFSYILDNPYDYVFNTFVILICIAIPWINTTSDISGVKILMIKLGTVIIFNFILIIGFTNFNAFGTFILNMFKSTQNVSLDMFILISCTQGLMMIAGPLLYLLFFKVLLQLLMEWSENLIYDIEKHCNKTGGE